MNYLISVIVPIYNMEKYLSRCVESIRNQDHTNLEIILVDDGSTDQSAVMCDEYEKIDKRVRVIHKVNGGLSSARNAGLEIAQGDYIGFVDSDDYIASNMYSNLLYNIYGKSGTISNVMYKRVCENGEEYLSSVIHTKNEKIESLEYLRELLLHVGDVSVCTKLFDRKIIGELRFDENRLNEDLLFMISLLSRFNEIQFVGEVGYYYFERKSSISSSYGKAVEDMVINSLSVKEYVDNNYPEMNMEAKRFALFQHMGYLMLVPRNKAVRGNALYENAVQYVRRNTIKNMKNPYLTCKNKLILLGLSCSPHFVAELNRLKQTSKKYRNHKRRKGE